MARVFTITEGLENMGALRTGGQGSVYKGKRIGEIITAVKLLPTPIHTESADDKNFRDFQNEVEKLKKVNEQPNPNVVRILSSGITESGSFPFIEMEFIEGPDLEELLKPPHDALFTIKEVIKVAEHLSNALAHCHKVSVKHGDIKSNNVKLNSRTGNYVLLDFGLSAMSDEQRRTSLRHAGAIEFMAPEQNEGLLLFQTDVYSYGVILYELLAGTVPFPLKDKGETARNNVMVSHMEMQVPDVLEWRRKNMPQNWKEDVKAREQQVPSWLVTTIARCLDKDPKKRFANGVELQNHILHNSTLAMNVDDEAPASLDVAQNENARLRRLILEYQEAIGKKDRELERLSESMSQKDGELTEIRNSRAYVTGSRKGVSMASFLLVLLLLIGLAAYSAYTLFFAGKHNSDTVSGVDTTLNSIDTTSSNAARENTEQLNRNRRPKEPVHTETQTNPEIDPVNTYPKQDNQDTTQSQDDNTPKDSSPNIEGLKRYKVINRAYFHNEPDESTRRNAFIVHWNNAVLTPIEERDGFVYVIYTNSAGQTSKGWLSKKDLKETE
jgi:serine/threonine protein kinase